MFRKYVVSIGALLLLPACIDSGSVLPVSDSFDLETYQGTWQSDGYGYILQIEQSGLALYDVSLDVCIKKQIPSSYLAANMSHFEMLSENSIEVSATKGASSYRFDKINGLPEECSHVADKSKVATFDYFARVMADHYAFFDLYNVDWQERANTMRPLIKDDMTDQALYEVMTSMMVGLEDAHLSLSAEVAGEEVMYKPGRSIYLRPALDKAFAAQNEMESDRKFRRAWFTAHKNNIRQAILSGQENETFGGRIIWGTIGDIGYINFLGMRGFSDTELLQDEMAAAKSAIDQVMSEIKSSKAIIIDVTTNSGGEDELGRIFAGYFTDKPTLAYSKIALKADKKSAQEFHVQPAAENRFTGPVYIVTSDHTVSAAETFTLALRALPNVTHVGEVTRGALSDILDKSLPNDWELGLSNESYFDATGTLWEGQGVQPQKHVPIFQGKDIYTSHQEAMKEIIEFVRADLSKSNAEN